MEVGYHEVTVEELRALLGREDVLVVDLREPIEYERGHIPGAVLVPVRAMPQQVKRLPRGKKLVFVCGLVGGMKSVVASEIALAEGFPSEDIYAVVDGYPVWQRRGYPLVPGFEPGSWTAAKPGAAKNETRRRKG